MWDDDIEAAQYFRIKTIDTVDVKTGNKITKEVEVPLYATGSQSDAGTPQIGVGIGLEQRDDFGDDIPIFDEMPESLPRPRKVSRE